MHLPTENIKRKNPINRNNLFFSEHQFDVLNAFGMEYVNKVVNQTVVLYEVDRENTKVDDIYQESKYSDIAFKTPVELNVLYLIDKPELKTYDSEVMKGYYLKMGRLTFRIYEKELEENGCDIQRGDYVGIQVTEEHMEFFKVTNDGRMNYDNAHSMYGLKPLYRTIECAVVDDVKETHNL